MVMSFSAPLFHLREDTACGRYDGRIRRFSVNKPCADHFSSIKYVDIVTYSLGSFIS